MTWISSKPFERNWTKRSQMMPSTLLHAISDIWPSTWLDCRSLTRRVTKLKMVTNLKWEKSGWHCCLQGVPEIRERLEEFVTKRTLKMFSVIAEQGKEKAKSSILKEGLSECGRKTQCSWR